MKKVCSWACLVWLLLAMVLPVGAQENGTEEDSRIISDAILAQLEEGTVDTVIRIYSMADGPLAFSRFEDIGQMLANAPKSQVIAYYWVKDIRGEGVSYTYDGTGLVTTNHASDWVVAWVDQISKKTETIFQYVAADLVVENAYYLRFNNWFTLYYKTNMGDYAYIMSGNNEYLMDSKQFGALQDELYAQWFKCREFRTMTGHSYEIKLKDLRVDLSSYDITSPNFDPYAPLKTNHSPGKFIAIGLLVLLVALIVGRFLIRGKWKYWVSKDNVIRRI